MKTIWKFPLRITDEQFPMMPVGARALSVARDPSGEGLLLWALVDPNAPVGVHVIRIYGTGHSVDDSSGFIGTVVDGPFVWHVFSQDFT